MPKPSTLKLVLAFAAVYIIWGSTYLAIRTCVETMPPFLMAGSRFVLAGAVLYLAARLCGAAAPTLAHWRRSAAVGFLLIVAGNGLVVWSEQRVNSSTAALMIAMAPVWFAVLAWAFRGEHPTPAAFAGIGIGLAGIVLLIGPGTLGTAVDPAGTLALLVASLAWAAGSLLAKSYELPDSPLAATGLQLISGGALSLLAGLALGETARLDLARISAASWMAWGYLIVFGTLIGFTAYSWLIRVVSPSTLSTYAYVNPVVALILGATLGGEHLSARALAAAGVILAGVLLMTTGTAPLAYLRRKLFTMPRHSDGPPESFEPQRPLMRTR